MEFLTFEENKPISYQLAEQSKRFYFNGKHWKPLKDSGFVELFGHSKEHTPQTIVLKANKAETPALKIGGSEYTLAQLAEVLGHNVKPTLKSKARKIWSGHKHHQTETSLDNLPDAYFSYFIEHGIANPKVLLKSLGAKLTTIYADTNNGYVFEQFHGKKAFLFTLPNQSWKYFILDEQFKVIRKLTNACGRNCTYPNPTKDNETDLLVVEGFADVLRAREIGYNAFTSSGGVGNIADLVQNFKVIAGRTVFICLDQDRASQEKLPSIANEFLVKGHQVKIIELSFKEEGKDLCDYLKENSISDFKNLVKNATLFQFEDNEIPPQQPFKEEGDNSNCFVFWYTVKKSSKQNENPQYVLKIDQKKLLDFIELSGFAPLFLPGATNGDSILVRLTNNIIEEVNTHKIKAFAFDYVRNQLPEELPETEDKTKEDLLRELIKSENILFNKTKMQCIPCVMPRFHRCVEDTSYFYFSNGFVKASKDGFTLLPYEKLDGVIWKNQILKREFKATDDDCDFKTFLGNICNQEPKRFLATRTAIGYLLHRYKEPSLSKAIILVDEKISDTPEGGTGKSLIANAINFLRNTLVLDGKDFDFESRFAFQEISFDTDLIVFDDVVKKFKFEKLFHKITGGLEVESKNKPRLKIPYEAAPKFLVTTNYTVQDQGYSTERRKEEYELYPYYGKNKSPKEDFGRLLFNGWPSQEWSKFDNFMLHCAVEYFQKGLQSYRHKNLEERKLLQEIPSQNFLDFADNYFFGFEENGERKQEFELLKFGVVLKIPDILEEFCQQFSEYRKKIENEKFRQATFTKWLKTYCRYNEIEVEEKRKREGQKVVRCLIFSLLSK